MGTFSKGVLLDQVVPVSQPLSKLRRLRFDPHFSAAHRMDYFKSLQLCLTSLAMPTVITHVYSTADSTYSILLLGFETGAQVSEAGLELLVLLPLPPDIGIIGLHYHVRLFHFILLIYRNQTGCHVFP